LALNLKKINENSTNICDKVDLSIPDYINIVDLTLNHSNPKLNLTIDWPNNNTAGIREF
jgi:hypothetical protein